MSRMPIVAGRWSALFLLLVSSAGCGLRTHLAVGSMVPILENTADAARERRDLGTVEKALPANLLLLDGLIRTEPDNRSLLTLGAYLYFGYALGFVETADPGLAATYYAMGRDYGFRALDHCGAFRRGCAGNLEDFERGVKSLTKEDVPAMAWTGADWGRWLSLNLDSPAAVADLPRLEALLTRLDELNPEFEHGLPEALLGIYDATRPAMFGGNTGRAKAHFDRAFEISGRHVLIYLVFYAEYYCRQTLDQPCFEKTLDEVDSAPVGALPDENLLNEIARKRAVELRAKEPELF